jgi:hypothetical protein
MQTADGRGVGDTRGDTDVALSCNHIKRLLQDSATSIVRTRLGKTSMENRPDQMPPRVSSEQKRSGELVKLVRKLRWIGMEDEAEQVEKQLLLQQVPAADSVIAASRETD